MIKNCDYNFCIYNNNNQCTLEKIYINGEGCCGSLLLPQIPHEKLDDYKLKTLQQLKNRHK